MKKVLITLVFTVLAMAAFTQSQGDYDEMRIRNYLIYNDYMGRTAATGDSILAFVGDSDTLTKVPMPAGGGGTGEWVRNGNYIYPTNTTDSTVVGGTTPQALFHVYGGNAKIDDTTFTGDLTVTGDANIGNDVNVGGTVYVEDDIDIEENLRVGANSVGFTQILFSNLPIKQRDSMLMISNDSIYKWPYGAGGADLWQDDGGGSISPASATAVRADSIIPSILKFGGTASVFYDEYARGMIAADNNYQSFGYGARVGTKIGDGNIGYAVFNGAGTGDHAWETGNNYWMYFDYSDEELFIGYTAHHADIKVRIGDSSAINERLEVQGNALIEDTLKVDHISSPSGYLEVYNDFEALRYWYNGLSAITHSSTIYYFGEQMENAIFGKKGDTYVYAKGSVNELQLRTGNVERAIFYDTKSEFYNQILISGQAIGSSDSILYTRNDSVFKGPAASGGVTINDNTNNNLLTASGTANTINGESDLTYNGQTLNLSFDGGGATIFDIDNYTSGSPSAGITTTGYNGASAASYSAVQNADMLGWWYFQGSESSVGVDQGAIIKATANETWSGSTHGTKLELQVAYDNGAASGEPVTHIAIEDSVTTISHILRLTPLSSAPTGVLEGSLYYNSTAKKIYVYNGTSWDALN